MSEKEVLKILGSEREKLTVGWRSYNEIFMVRKLHLTRMRRLGDNISRTPLGEETIREINRKIILK
jgi:hypothetical protein